MKGFKLGLALLGLTLGLGFSSAPATSDYNAPPRLRHRIALYFSPVQRALAHIQSLDYEPSIDFLASPNGAQFLQEVINCYPELRELIPDHALFERPTMLRKAAFSWTVIRRILVEFCDFEEGLTDQIVAETAYAFRLRTPFNPRR